MKQAKTTTKCNDLTDTTHHCGDLLTSIAVNVFLMESQLDNNSPASLYLTRIKQELSEAHFLTNARSTSAKQMRV